VKRKEIPGISREKKNFLQKKSDSKSSPGSHYKGTMQFARVKITAKKKQNPFGFVKPG